MDSKLKTKIMSVRPHLSVVAPLTHAISWGFVVVNFLLGAGMYFLYEPDIPLAVVNIFSYQVWGILFISVAVASTYTLIRNYWYGTRYLLLAGLLIKAAWAIALIIRCFSAPGTVLVTLVWLFLAYIQAATYIFFLSKNEKDKAM